MAKVVTKKIILITMSVVIALSGIIWVIVANFEPKFNSGIKYIPGAYTVSGNGTGSVMVDDYLYFVGGYKSAKEIVYGENDYYSNGKMQESGIYRIKIDDGKPVVNYEYDNYYYDENNIKQEYPPEHEKYNTVVKSVADWHTDSDWWDKVENKNKKSLVDKVVPKMAGHENTAMWVFGNTLIYTSPNNLRNKVGVLRSDYLDFFRVDLDGKNNTLIYSASVPNLTKANYSVWANSSDNIYLLINEEGTLKKINVSSKEVTEIDNKVTAVTFPSVSQYRTAGSNSKLSDVYGGVMSYVYYSKNRDTETDSSKGNLMYRYSIAGNKDYKAEKIGDEGDYNKGISFTPVALIDGRFIFSTGTVVGDNTSNANYSIVTNDMSVNTVQEYRARYANGMSTYMGSSSDSIKFYADGFWSSNKKLRRYMITNSGIDIADASEYSADVEDILAIFDNKIYVKKASSVDIYNFNKELKGTITLSTDNDDGAPQLPISFLIPAYSDGSLSTTSGLIFVQNKTKTTVSPGVGSDSYVIKM